MNLGDELDLIYQVKTPLENRAPYTYSVIAGSYLAIATIGSGAYLSATKDRLTATQAALQSQDQTQIANLTREDVLGDMFYTGVLGYFAEYTAISHIIALQQRAGQSLAIGYGSYGYEPNVSYYFGIPRSIEPGGAVMNVRVGNFVTTHTNDHAQEVQLNEQLGLLSSTLESAIPEQMFVTPTNPGEAISAVKAIAKAEQAGQRIYRITPANRATTLPNIHHNNLVMQEIRDSLAAGKEVITHTDDVSVLGWTGAGYIIIDPNTGIGAYKIGGGANGGIMYLSGYMAALSIMSLVFLPGAAAAFGAIVSAVIMTFAASFALAASVAWKVPISTLLSSFICGFSGGFANFMAADSIMETAAFSGKSSLMKVIAGALAAYGFSSTIGMTPCI